MRDYNFFDPYEKKWSPEINFTSPGFYSLLILLLILGVTVGAFVQNKMLADEQALLSTELNALKESPLFQEAEAFNQSLGALQEYDQYAATALEKIDEGSILGTNLLNKLSSAMPSSATLTSLNATTATLTFTASIPTKAAAAELLLRMEESGLFRQIAINSVVIAGDAGTYTATLNGIVKAGDQE